MSEIHRYYWDSCIWIDLIKGDDNHRVDQARRVLRLALQGKVRLCISAITLTEVRKDNSSNGTFMYLNGGERATFEDLLRRDVIIFNVSKTVGYTARNLQSKYPGLAKAGLADSIHVAACVYYCIHTLHTFDKGLISLSNQFECWDGEALTICKPEDQGT